MARAQFVGTRRFEIRSRLGQGAVGVVYEVFDREQNAVVAIKTLSTPNAETIRLLKNEFRAVQDVQHPNLVQLGELIEEDGAWFFTMEFVRGVDLLQYVRTGSPRIASGSAGEPISGEVTKARADLGFDEARLRAAFVQLTRGLQALHAAQKIHRDVKPSNVMVERDGRVVVLDFGIASDLLRRGHGAAQEGLTGTVWYMAPEQAASEEITSAADWYAVGAVLYQALTGDLPFAGSANEILEQKLTREPEPPSARVPGIPRDLDELCADLLRLEPAARPDGAAILRRLGADVEEQVSGRHLVFVGRRDELRKLERGFEDARAHAVTMYVEGESGVGKSYLVRNFTDRVLASHPDTLLFFGRCYERESVPYKAIDGIVDGIAEHLVQAGDAADGLIPEGIDLLARVFPVLAPLVPRGGRSTFAEILNPQEQRLRVFGALRTLLARMAERTPVVLVIDDLQWADADSLALLEEVLRTPHDPRVLIVVTIRLTTSINARGLSAGSLVAGDVRRVRLEKLTAADTEELTTRLLGPGATAEEVRAIAMESSGHPLFVDELVRHGSLRGSGTMRVRLDDALWARVERLDAAARRLLEVTAVAGLPIRQETAASAASLDFGQLFQLAAVLRGARFVKTTGVSRDDVIEAYHDRVRESVLAHLDATTRKTWHARLAVALEATPNADPEMLTTHWQGAGQVERAVSYAVAAGDRAAKALAFDRAARLYARALELGVAGTPEATTVKQRLAEALTNAGRGAEAADVRLDLAASAPPVEALDLRRRAAEQLLCSGHFDRGVALLRETLDEVGVAFPESPIAVVFFLLFFRLVARVRGLSFAESDPSRLPGRALVRIDSARSAGAGFSMSDNIRGAYFQTRNLLLALDVGDPQRIMHALAMDVCFNAAGGTHSRERTAALLRSADELAERVATPAALALANVGRGYWHFFLGEWPQATEYLARAEELFRDRCIGVAFELASVRAMLFRALGYRGRILELVRRSEPVMREVEGQGDRYSAINLRATVRTLTGLAADEPDRVRKEVGEAIQWLARKRFLVQHFFCFCAETQLDLYVGDPVAAYERAQRTWPALRRSLLLRVQSILIGAVGWRARAAIAAMPAVPERHAELAAVALRDAKRLEREKHPWATAEATLLRASVAAAEGDTARAIALYDDAARRFDALGMLLYAASARRRHGELLGGDEGAALVRASDDAFRAEEVRVPEKLARMCAPDVARPRS